MKQPLLRLARMSAVAVRALGIALPAWATITDDINPFGNIVRVRLINPETVAVSGTVTVQAGLSTGLAVQSSAPYPIPAGGDLVVDVEFPDKVEQVIEVSAVDEK